MTFIVTCMQQVIYMTYCHIYDIYIYHFKDNKLYVLIYIPNIIFNNKYIYFKNQINYFAKQIYVTCICLLETHLKTE